MVNRYRKAAPTVAHRTNRRHAGVPKLAAQISGRSLTMVYKVIYGQAKSAIVEQAIEDAERELGITGDRVA